MGRYSPCRRKECPALSRLDIKTPSRAQTVVEGLYRDMERRIAASPPGLCPVDMSLSFLQLCHAQTCGKCVPCRIGLGQLTLLINQVLDGEATMETIAIIEKTARSIVNTADCAIGRDAARLVVEGLEGFRDDYEEHVKHNRCLAGLQNPVPCVALCPAGVDIPGYMALVGEGRCADAVRLIRKDNPFPTACAYICEHPCEARCRRNMVDDAINIRGLKRYAVDHAGVVPQPECAPATGKKVAIIGGGPSGLSCAYYLALMGHGVTVYEEREQLGGMLRYGIPSYRFPREKLDAEIESILSLGIEVHTGVTVGRDIWLEKLEQEYDCIYIAIGAHQDKKTGIPGENSKNVISAVEMLRAIGDKFKVDHLTNLLTGRLTAQIKSYGHNKSKWFGAGAEHDARFWGAVLRQALILGLVDKNIENYGLISVNRKGENFIAMPFPVTVTLDHDYDEEEKEAEAVVPMGKGGAADEELFAMLKDLRKKVAKQHGLPPFVIFQDPSLEDMAVQYPITIEEMQNITGVGVGKARKFGEEFVKLIKAYVEEKEIIRPQDMIVKSVGNKSGNKIFIIQSIDRKMDFEDIARAKDLDFDELLTEIEGIVNSGTKLDISYYLRDFMDEDKIEDIYLYFKEDAQSDSLDAAIDELGADYTEEEIRLVRIKFICEQGN